MNLKYDVLLLLLDMLLSTWRMLNVIFCYLTPRDIGIIKIFKLYHKKNQANETTPGQRWCRSTTSPRRQVSFACKDEKQEIIINSWRHRVRRHSIERTRNVSSKTKKPKNTERQQLRQNSSTLDTCCWCDEFPVSNVSIVT